MKLKMGELRGKYNAMLQASEKDKQAMELDMKTENAAWSDLMGTTVKQIQQEMNKGLNQSVQRINELELELSKEKEKNKKLETALMQFTPQHNN